MQQNLHIPMYFLLFQKACVALHSVYILKYGHMLTLPKHIHGAIVENFH